MVLAYPDVGRAADDVVEIHSYGPTALEGFQDTVVRHLREKGKPAPGARFLPDGGAWLLAEFGGETPAEANDKVETAYRRLRRFGTHATEMRLIEQPEDQAEVWHVRESGVGASRVEWEEEAWPSWEDAAVPPARLGDYLRDFDKLNQRYGYRYTLFGHFGQGCIHTRITFDLKTEKGVRTFRKYMHEAADLCLSYGGSLSGEHGDGQAKGELLPKMFGPRLMEAFRSADSTLPAVILWPDTFNNYLLPGTAKAAVTVLESAGYRVLVPHQSLCCGRPLYDYGMLNLAHSKLHQILDALRHEIRAGIPVVVLEPSCLSVFRDEMTAIQMRKNWRGKLRHSANCSAKRQDGHRRSWIARLSCTFTVTTSRC